MRRGCKLALFACIFVLLILSLSLTSAVWPFTGNTINVKSDRFVSCQDSDSSRNYTSYGYLTFVYANKSGAEVTDYAADSCSGRFLFEYYCDGNKAKSEFKYCSYGCENSSVQASSSRNLNVYRCRVNPKEKIRDNNVSIIRNESRWDDNRSINNSIQNRNFIFRCVDS